MFFQFYQFFQRTFGFINFVYFLFHWFLVSFLLFSFSSYFGIDLPVCFLKVKAEITGFIAFLSFTIVIYYKFSSKNDFSYISHIFMLCFQYYLFKMFSNCLCDFPWTHALFRNVFLISKYLETFLDSLLLLIFNLMPV